MKVVYDPEADILYIMIRDEKVKETRDLDEDIWIDVNDRGEIVGIEIWQARKHIISEILEFLRKGKEVGVTAKS